jgi:hypothetical protein
MNIDLSIKILPDDVCEGNVEGIHIAWTNSANLQTWLVKENDDVAAMKSFCELETYTSMRVKDRKAVILGANHKTS